MSVPELEVVAINNPEELNFIFGTTHFIKSVEDIYEALVQSSASLKFGLAFCEASGPRLVRTDGNDPALIDYASTNAVKVGCGHTFFVFLREGYPINVLNALKMVPEVASIHCATQNPAAIVVAKHGEGRGFVSVIDGGSPVGVESDEDKETRKAFLRAIGYKR